MSAIVFPKIQRHELRLMNEVIGRYRQLIFDVRGTEYELIFTVPAIAPAVSLPSAISVKLQAHQNVFWVALQEDIFSNEFVNYLGAPASESLPSPLLELAVEALLEELLNQLRDKIGLVVSIMEVRLGGPPEAEDAGGRMPFRLQRIKDGTSVFGQIHGDVRTWQIISTVVNNAPLASTQYFDACPIPVSIELGRTRLSAGDLDGLNPMDILLLDSCRYFADNSVQVNLPTGLSFQAKLKNNELRIEKMITEKKIATREVTPVASTEQAAGSIKVDEIPVQLVFELGSVMIPLKDLQTLQPGYTFELPASVGKPVTIKANQQAVGTGEILQIGEQVGVRIVEFTKP